MDNAIVQPVTCIPPRLLKRNEHGLICEGVNYVYKEDGLIDWRKMIKPEYLVVKKDNFEKKGKPVPASIEGLEDKDLLILLGGIKNVAKIRGYRNVRFNIAAASPSYVSMECFITWIPNFETYGEEETRSGTADAHAGNTGRLGQNYLTAFAENRAFVRAVRNYLEIPILGQDEVGPSEGATTHASVTLKDVMDQHGITFEFLKQKLIDEGVEGAENYTNIDSIPRFKQMEIIARIEKRAAEKKKVNG